MLGRQCGAFLSNICEVASCHDTETCADMYRSCEPQLALRQGYSVLWAAGESIQSDLKHSCFSQWRLLTSKWRVCVSCGFVPNSVRPRFTLAYSCCIKFSLFKGIQGFQNSLQLDTEQLSEITEAPKDGQMNENDTWLIISQRLAASWF